MPGDLSEADLLEHHLLGLSEKDWKAYADKQGFAVYAISVTEDGVQANTPDAEYFLRDFERRYQEQHAGGS